MRRLRDGYIGLGIFAVIGLAAALTRPDAEPVDVLPTLIGALAGAYALSRLVRVAGGRSPRRLAPGGTPPALPPRPDRPRSAPQPDVAPPDFIVPADPAVADQPEPEPAAGPVRARRGASARPALPQRPALGRTAPAAPGSRAAAASSPRARWRWPRAASAPWPAGPSPSAPTCRSRCPTSGSRGPRTRCRRCQPGTDLNIKGLSPFITPNSAFYRVDTALILPQVAPQTWQLRIHGMVEREITLSYHDLLRRPLIEDWITLCCVSNPVGRPLHRQRQVARAPAWPACCGRPGPRPARTSCCAPRPTGSPPAPRWPRSWTAGTRCWPWP